MNELSIDWSLSSPSSSSSSSSAADANSDAYDVDMDTNRNASSPPPSPSGGADDRESASILDRDGAASAADSATGSAHQDGSTAQPAAASSSSSSSSSSSPASASSASVVAPSADSSSSDSPSSSSSSSSSSARLAAPKLCGRGADAVSERFVVDLLNYFARADASASSAALPSIGDFLRILAHARRLLSPLPNIVRVPAECQRAVVVGDLHGQLDDLLTVLAQTGLPQFPRNVLIFNGDFVDRGPHSCEVLLVLLALKCWRPEAVYLNRGNHEVSVNSVSSHTLGSCASDIFYLFFARVMWKTLFSGA